MATRTVTDSAGRAWSCSSELGANDNTQGRDVSVDCSTAAVVDPVRITVGWQWEKMADAGLARLISTASPAPRR